MEKRRTNNPNNHYNSTGDLRKLSVRQHSSHQDDGDVHPDKVVQAFSHHHASSPTWQKPAKGFLASVAFVIFITIMTSGNARRPRLRGGRAPVSPLSPDGHRYSFGGSKRPGYFYAVDAVISSHEFLFAAVTDQDKASRDPSATLEKPRFKASLLPGVLKRDIASGKYAIEFRKEREIVTKHNEAGRGAEYSDLQLFDHRLLTFDDRTGTVVEILNADNGMSSTVSPRFVFTEGYGHSDKGMKWEWATVKDGELIMGSIGKELTNKDLTFKSQAGMWVVALNSMGQTRRIDWTDEYNFVRMQLFADLPGYVVHEAVHWSHHLNRWIFLPRRISQQPYSPRTDEMLGSNKILLVDEGFQTSTTVEVNFEKYNEEDGGLHGFSAFSFVPNTKDQHVLAIRSVEEDCWTDNDEDCKFRSYFCVFNVLTGDLLMDEVPYDAPLKFEGLEFVNLYAKPPPSMKEYE